MFPTIELDEPVSREAFGVRGSSKTSATLARAGLVPDVIDAVLHRRYSGACRR